MQNYEKWLWIGLLGFDNEQCDLGVNDLLERMCFIPKGCALLLSNADFVHAHNGLKHDARLHEDQCSYGGCPNNEDRERQQWTKFQLKSLITELQKHDIEVYFSVFDQQTSNDRQTLWNIPYRPRWIDNHEELYYVKNHGEMSRNICPWKRLQDGTLYEDFFIGKMIEVLEDYGFDGFHGADGYAHPRFPICVGDFSDDMIDQFSDTEKVSVPFKNVTKRAAWICENVKREWIDFHAKRHQQFWRKAVNALRTINCKLIFNTAWTRDPFEAKYRYGVDYKMLADIGVETFIVEAPAAVVELEGWNKSNSHTLDQYMSMIMRINAYVPQCKLLLLNCIKDNTEQYNVLRHAPKMFESDVYSMSNVFRSEVTGQFVSCLSGTMACLAGGISHAEWNMIGKVWDKGFSTLPVALSGATVVWSDYAMANELESYKRVKSCNSHRMHYHLLTSGAAIHGIINIEDINSFSDCLVVIHPRFLSADELQKLSEYRNGQVVFVGLDNDDEMTCSLYDRDQELSVISADSFTVPDTPEPASWLDELPEVTPEKSFFSNSAKLINQCLNAPESVDQSSYLRCWGVDLGMMKKRVFVRNDKSTYEHTKIDIKRKIKSVQAVTEDPCVPVFWRNADRFFEGSIMELKIPPGNTLILEVELIEQ